MHWLDVERPDHPLQRLVMLAHASGDRQALEASIRAVRVEKHRLREQQRVRERAARFTEQQKQKALAMLAKKGK
jgi:hypothetical protein